MKNIQKWQQAEKVIFSVSKETPRDKDIKELTKRYIAKPNIEDKDSNPEYDNVRIVIKDAMLILFSDKFGSYMEALSNKRNRINVVPLCYLTQLYNITTNNEKEIIIPFELRSFWKMEKAIQLVGELSNILMNQKLVLQSLKRVCAFDNQKDKIEEALKVVNSLQIIPPEEGKVTVQFLESKFTVNANNVKLDIIPLCKILVQYYVQFVTCMDECYTSFNTYYSKQRIYNTRCKMQKFMNQYFTLGANYC